MRLAFKLFYLYFTNFTQSNLITGLKETLDKLTYAKLLEGDAAEGEKLYDMDGNEFIDLILFKK
mgnify:CR=1 FL=1